MWIDHAWSYNVSLLVYISESTRHSYNYPILMTLGLHQPMGYSTARPLSAQSLKQLYLLVRWQRQGRSQHPLT